MSTEFRYLVRVRGKDLNGAKKLVAALADIKGLGYNFSTMLVSSLGLNPKMRVGFLSDAQVRDIEKALLDMSTLNIPPWALNRQRDLETGETKMLVASDLDIAIKNDVLREADVKSWRGVRHSLGLKVRGQRTRTTGRKGKTVGVRKSTLQAAAAAAAKTDEKK